MKIGFIGTGVMGTGIINNLLKNKHEIYVYNRTKSKSDEVVKNGAIYINTPKEVAEKVELIMTMVGMPEDVENVYLGENSIIEGLKPGSIAVDLTTSKPSQAISLAEKLKEKDIAFLDAPVSGGDKGAKEGTLTIMVGGEEETFKKVKPIFEQIGKTIKLQGKSGAGQHTKMANQIALAGNMLGAIEMIVYERNAGLNDELVLETVSGGSAASTAMQLYAKRIFGNDYEPGFYIKHFVKDLKIALEECEKMNIELLGLETAYEIYEVLEKSGYSEEGTQALIKYYEKKMYLKN